MATRKIKSIISKKGYKVIFPAVYLLGLALSLILFLLYSFFPSLIICSSLFGQQFCTPLGVYIASIISLPGYFITGNLLNIPSEMKWYGSLIYVILSSGLFYYLLGWLIDKLKGRSISKTSRFIIALFIILLFILFFLLTKIPQP